MPEPRVPGYPLFLVTELRPRSGQPTLRRSPTAGLGATRLNALVRERWQQVERLLEAALDYHSLAGNESQPISLA